LQIALERGIPALIVWLILIAVYIRMLWRIVRRDGADDFSRGLAAGALGGALGFLTSGLVHYNWGDSEVVTIFYFIMGLCLVVERTSQRVSDSSVRG
jgi:O-antigen ligase